MSRHYNAFPASIDKCVLALDASNHKSWSQNIYPKPLDIYAWSAGTAFNCTVSRDYTTLRSPAGGIPMRMDVTANDCGVATYQGMGWNLAPAANGETWTVSMWVKGNQAGGNVEGPLIFGCDSSGNYLTVVSGGSFAVGTAWTRISYTTTFSNASIAYIQVRLDGPNTGGAGQTYWMDGVQVEKYGSATAFNPKYNASMSTWYDLTGNNNNATIYGKPVYSETEVNGYFDFAAVTGANSANASIGFTFANNMVPRTGNFAISCWYKNPPANAQAGLFSNSGAGDGYRFGPCLGSTYVLCGIPYAESNLTYTSTFDNAKWHNTIAVFDRTGVETGSPRVVTYLDGVLQTNYMALTAPQTQAMSALPGIVHTACCTLWPGKLAALFVYAGHIDANEAKMIFASLRGRFGI